MFKKKIYTSTVYCSILPEEMLCVFEYGDTDPARQVDYK